MQIFVIGILISSSVGTVQVICCRWPRRAAAMQCDGCFVYLCLFTIYLCVRECFRRFLQLPLDIPFCHFSLLCNAYSFCVLELPFLLVFFLVYSETNIIRRTTCVIIRLFTWRFGLGCVFIFLILPLTPLSTIRAIRKNKQLSIRQNGV